MDREPIGDLRGTKILPRHAPVPLRALDELVRAHDVVLDVQSEQRLPLPVAVVQDPLARSQGVAGAVDELQLLGRVAVACDDFLGCRALELHASHVCSSGLRSTSSNSAKPSGICFMNCTKQDVQRLIEPR